MPQIHHQSPLFTILPSHCDTQRICIQESQGYANHTGCAILTILLTLRSTCSRLGHPALTDSCVHTSHNIYKPPFPTAANAQHSRCSSKVLETCIPMSVVSSLGGKRRIFIADERPVDTFKKWVCLYLLCTSSSTQPLRWVSNQQL